MPTVNFDRLFQSFPQVSEEKFVTVGLSIVGVSDDITGVTISKEGGRAVFFGYTEKFDGNMISLICPDKSKKLYGCVGKRIFKVLDSHFHEDKAWIDNGNFVFELHDNKVDEFVNHCKQLMSLNRRLMNISF